MIHNFNKFLQKI